MDDLTKANDANYFGPNVVGRVEDDWMDGAADVYEGIPTGYGQEKECLLSYVDPYFWRRKRRIICH